MLTYVQQTILGMNSVQLYMKVPGSRTPGKLWPGAGLTLGELSSGAGLTLGELSSGAGLTPGEMSLGLNCCRTCTVAL